MRVLIAGIVGGIIMFMWGFVAHTALPLGKMGVKQIPNEDAVISVLKANITEHSLYFIPGMDMSKDVSEAEQDAWEAKYKAGPIGVLAFKPTGRDPMGLQHLITEFAFTLLAALLGSFVVAHVTGGYLMRVLSFFLFGLIGWTSLGASHWNWYSFPKEYSIAEVTIEAVAWLLVGIVCAAIVKPQVTKVAV